MITASIKQLSDDMTTSFKELADYQIKTEHQLETCSNLVDARLDRLEARLDRLETLLTQILERLIKTP